MKRYLLLFLLLPGFTFSQLTTYRNNVTLPYDEAIELYRMLDGKYENAKLIEEGMTDAGKPLHLFLLNTSGIFDADELHKKNECIILVNNGIHPGEPDGINASLEFAADILSGRVKLPPHVTLAIIPVYNIDGALNRGCCSRANQNGPEEYGFRGNAQNLDLNRDFIKADAENTKSFIKIFRQWDPDILIDTHVSDGADYQHTMTLIATQKDKLHPAVSSYVQKEFLPSLYKKMQELNTEMCPYVNAWENTPDKGFEGFLETPRFATGYAALFHTIGFVTETHMLKPYPQRVEATYAFLYAVTDLAGKNFQQIKAARKKAKEETLLQEKFSLQWKVDTTKTDSIFFKGYEPAYKKSDVTGMDRLYYDRSKPFSRYVPYYNTFVPVAEVTRPKAYIIPQAWSRVIERMKLNGVKMERMNSDTMLTVNAYYITNYKSGAKPYEGHHLNTDVQVDKRQQKILFFKGDYIIYCNQEANRYIVETLEPLGVDSWFAWGFFDAVLQQKEWYGDYIFIDEAEQMLKKDPALKKEFDAKKNADPAFAKDQGQMLTWLYQRSKYYEPSHNRCPAYRIEQ
jgi:hypothetical protein